MYAPNTHERTDLLQLLRHADDACRVSTPRREPTRAGSLLSLVLSVCLLLSLICLLLSLMPFALSLICLLLSLMPFALSLSDRDASSFHSESVSEYSFRIAFLTCRHAGTDGDHRVGISSGGRAQRQHGARLPSRRHLILTHGLYAVSSRRYRRLQSRR